MFFFFLFFSGVLEGLGFRVSWQLGVDLAGARVEG